MRGNKKMKRIRRVSIIVLTVAFMLMNAVPALAAESTAYTQVDASSIPYKVSPNTYLITQSAVLTWKKYNTILGFNDMGTAKNAEAITEVYENRVGDTVEGSLNYSWSFEGSVLQPILESKKGPINLGITLSQADNTLSVAYATTRVFDGSITIKLNVAAYFKDGEKLNLTYVSGVDASQIHGTDNSVTGVAPAAEEGLLVQEGCVTYTITCGGNYSLVKAAQEAIVDTTTKVTDSDEAATVTDSDDAAIIPDSDDTTLISDATDVTDTTDKDTVQVDADTVTKAPTTGSEQHIVLYVVVMLLTGAGLLVFRRKNSLQ